MASRRRETTQYNTYGSVAYAPAYEGGAIRIAVNDELASVDRMIRGAVPKLNRGGRLAVITFHSLEDRIVKNGFAQFAKGCTCPPDFPVCVCGKTPDIKLVNKKPILPTQQEIDENPRARSAKLRVAEKL